MSFGTTPAQVVNRALDAIGYIGTPVGDLEEGGTVAAAALRVYEPTRQQLLRAANWTFARREAPLTLLQDATGQTTLTNPAVGTGTYGMVPWTYEYAWPIDGVRARWLPQTWQNAGTQVPGNISLPSTPVLPTGTAAPLQPRRPPARFVVTTDIVPTQIGAITSWSQFPDYGGTHGLAPGQATVILTNVMNASLVYTQDVMPPDLWDPLFTQAMVATLGSLLAMPVLADKKFAIQMRAQMIASAKAALDLARVSDGDEGWSTVDHTPDWIRVRYFGAWGGAWGGFGGGFGGDGGLGYYGLGWGAMSFADGSAY